MGRHPEVDALERLVGRMEEDFAVGCRQPGEGDTLRDDAVMAAAEVEAALEPIRQRLLNLASRGHL